MALFEIVREVPLPPAEAWERLTTWERHGDHVPLTTVVRTSDGFVARTSLGPLGFDDPMDVVAWDPPSSCRLVKRGRVVTGWAELAVAPTHSGSRVVWREDIHVRGVPRALDAVTRAASRRVFSRVLDGLLGR